MSNIISRWRQYGAQRSLKALLAKANMNELQFNTGVVMSADGTFRVATVSGHPPWGDHVALGTFEEGQALGGVWHVAHFSPARARVIAQLLIQQANRVEGEQPQ